MRFQLQGGQISHRITSDVAQLREQNYFPGADKGWKQWKQNDHEAQWYLSAAVEDAVLLGEPAVRSTQHGTGHGSEHLTAR